MSKGGPQPPSYDPTAEEQKIVKVSVRSRTSSGSSTAASLRVPRTPRFAEATAVNSPIEPSQAGRSPFADPVDTMANGNGSQPPQPQPSDVGFGYLGEGGPQRTPQFGVSVAGESAGNEMPRSPLKSALRTPGTPGRGTQTLLSPTFREEQVLEKQEQITEKENAKDLKTKIRVRMAKVVLRGVNFSCSLIVLSMLAATFTIINATRHLPPRNNLPAWASGGIVWPQITLLVIACVSLLMCLVIFYAYWKGGHRRAEKAAVYYTVFAVAFFVFSIVMWAVAAGVLNESKRRSEGQDIWGWSCKDNKRKALFQDDVSYDLVCRMQDWALICCIIEVVVETITIAIYGIVFYRFYSKKKLRKSMDVRDKARSDLYLAQLRSQSAPNTPGFGGPMSPMSPMTPGYTSNSTDPHSKAEEGGYHGTQFASKSPTSSQAKPFQLQAPPIKVQHATPQPPQDGFEPPLTPIHVPAAPGEPEYGSVPVPSAYDTPVQSPTFAPPPRSPFGPPGQAITSEHRVESPPSSPRLPHDNSR
ncbi:MAG: hypothetical protein M1837_002260 [Sclerophora amabilis]|nr:MAG: hypothetical protein M1837_002260 [Sclerophora amabilis]